MSKEYYIGSDDYFGKNGSNEKFNKELVPFLKKLGIKEKYIDRIAKHVEDIY